jgi:hypothetical protein
LDASGHQAKLTLLPVDPGSSPELIDLGLVEMRDDVQVIACLTSNHRVPNGDQASRAAALAMKRGESGDFTGQ